MTQAHDPTSAGTSYQDQLGPRTQMSRNEIEMLCLKAARGAGMPWGLAEEAGFAAGWLAAHGVDGTAPLLDHLASMPVGDNAELSHKGRHWQAVSGQRLCPIVFGASLDDHAKLEAGPSAGPITSTPVSWPVLILPFLARMTRAADVALLLQWDQGNLTISCAGTADVDALKHLSQIAQSALTIGPLANPQEAPQTAPAHSTVAAAIPAVRADVLAGLNALAMRTTVPASDASRRGAGASAGDND